MIFTVGKQQQNLTQNPVKLKLSDGIWYIGVTFRYDMQVECAENFFALFNLRMLNGEMSTCS